MDYMEFIRRDMEPSGVNNRRRMACELLKGLATNYASQVKIILSQLHSFDNANYPMLTARSLKFLAMFSANIQKPVGIELFKELARLLQAESNVVHSYAASCIEKLLLVKEEDGKSRHVARDIDEVLIMRNLFDALKLVESEENPCVMKCIMWVLSVAEMSGDDEVCKLPKN
ncbi:unnamed protein product [Brassica oleracea var. botrytis]|uniref:Clathrin/coatomer adaptor adaptin-like N-terminal domain-containing protein n=1 Tax=Brassica oleracea TaxID=3712 RepID=A0A3P6D8C8_BRAOL|nr:unnamed protein product [Brassica oleracea]